MKEVKLCTFTEFQSTRISGELPETGRRVRAREKANPLGACSKLRHPERWPTDTGTCQRRCGLSGGVGVRLSLLQAEWGQGKLLGHLRRKVRCGVCKAPVWAKECFLYTSRSQPSPSPLVSHLSCVLRPLYTKLLYYNGRKSQGVHFTIR